MKYILSILVTAIVFVMSPVRGLCQIVSVEHITIRSIDHYDAEYYKINKADSSIIRDCNGSFQLIYTRSISDSCNPFMGCFRVVPYYNHQGSYYQGTDIKEYPVDLNLTDIKVLDEYIFFCGTDNENRWLFGTVKYSVDGIIPELELYYPGIITDLHKDCTEVVLPKKMDVYRTGSSNIFHLITVGDFQEDNSDNRPWKPFAAEMVVNMNMTEVSSPTYKTVYFTEGGLEREDPISPPNQQLRVRPPSKMSFEDVVVTSRYVALLGHIDEIGQVVEVAILCYSKQLNSSNTFDNPGSQSIIGNIHCSRTYQFSVLYDTYENPEKLVADHLHGDEIIFATGAICQAPIRTEVMAIDMIELKNRGNSIIAERLGQTAIHKELAWIKIVDIKACHVRESQIQFSDNDEYTHFSLYDVAILTEIDRHSYVVTTLKDLHKFLYKWNNRYTLSVNEDGNSINQPHGIKYKLYHDYTSIDISSNGESRFVHLISTADRGPDSKIYNANIRIIDEIIDEVPPIQQISQYSDMECIAGENVYSGDHAYFCHGHCYDRNYGHHLHLGIPPEGGEGVDPNIVKYITTCYTDGYSSNANIARLNLRREKSIDNLLCRSEVDIIATSPKDQYATSPIENELHTNNIIISPNPAADYSQLSSETIIKRVDVLNQIGICIFSIEPNSKNAMLYLSKLNPGIYFLRVMDEEGTTIKHFIKY